MIKCHLVSEVHQVREYSLSSLALRKELLLASVTIFKGGLDQLYEQFVESQGEYILLFVQRSRTIFKIWQFCHRL